MDGRGAARGCGSPGARAVPRNRSNEWRTRAYDSSSDNDELGPDVKPSSSSIVLAPATSSDLSGYNAPFSSGGGGGSGFGTGDQLHYAASKPVSSAIYQSLGRRRGRGRTRGPKHGSLSSSDNNSDTTTYAEGDIRSKMDALQSGLHTPPEPAPPEVPSRGPSSHQAVRSLQRLQQAGYPGEVGAALPSPSAQLDYRLPGSPRSHVGPTPLRGYGADHTDSYVNLNGGNARLALESQKTSSSSHEPVMPLVMPVYPAVHASTNLCHHSAPPAYSPQRRRLKPGQCRPPPCGWRATAACLALLSGLLLALTAYFAAAGVGGCSGVEPPTCGVHGDAVVMDPGAKQRNPITTPSGAYPAVVATTRAPALVRTPPPPSPPSRLSADAAVSHRLRPHQLWVLEYDVTQPQVLQLNVTGPWAASLAVYGSRNVAPSVTQHEWSAFLRAGRVQRARPPRAAGPEPASLPSPPTAPQALSTVSQPLEAGRWFVALLNDEPTASVLTVRAAPAPADQLRCPGDCSGRGACRLGVCACPPQYTGPDCAHSVCPVLCSSHGQYAGGRCHCDDGWKGVECELPATDCVIADCHGHGTCRVGQCVCAPGWKGEFCQKADCADPSCSGHGVCTEGVCVCMAGWVGPSCQRPDERIRRCLPDCSGHGIFDLSRDRCLCDSLWTGPQCQKPRCDLDCGRHGTCQAGDCACEPGWTGDLCQERTCDPRCHQHGQCKNGTCVCQQGWNGRHCSILGCPDGCSGHGTCATREGDRWYGCRCHRGWAGDSCSIHLELECNDGKDNDNDGMVDCSDSECCWESACVNSLMCLVSPEPVDVLLRKQPARQTASFYQRVRFLIEENSVQDYAEKDEYDERRVSVIRGQLVTSQGLGIVGVRVSVNRDTRFGLTLSRKDGWFDIMVNGGGAVNLQFQRAPFRPMTRAVAAAWNQLVVLEPVVMRLDAEPEPEPSVGVGGAVCRPHALQPSIVNTWQPELSADSSQPAVIIAESQVLQESISIPGTALRLVYSSQDAAGYHSTLLLQLTFDPVPETLLLVHLRVTVEGTVFSRTFESDPNITHSYSWNKRNVYEQKVYGMAEARVSVGYEYSDCAQVVWNTRALPIPGFRMDISDIGGWNLDIHHMYNFHEGILQRGDGSTVHLRRGARVVDTLLGTGRQRPLRCPPAGDACGVGVANASSLLTPVALASGADGSVYVGDFNLIRRVTPEGRVETVAELRATQVSFNYYMAMSPVEQQLYVSDPEARQVFRVSQMDQVADPSKNLELVAGTGERCLPGDTSNCGDGKPARLAKLAHPKGLTISAETEVYLADGTNIRVISPDGVISTLIGHHGHRTFWRPIPCAGSLLLSEVQLQWPTALALSPVDGALHVLDDRLVLRVSGDGRLRLRAGRPAHCAPPPPPLGTPIDLSLDAAGALYLAELGADGVHRVSRLSEVGAPSLVAGAPPACRCQADRCACQPAEGVSGTPLATDTHLASVSAVTAAADGSLYVADPRSLRVLRLRHNLPREAPGFKVMDPAHNQVYGFNRFGQHVETRDLLTGRPVYLFQYSENTSRGRLSRVTDWSGNSVQLVRDYSHVVSSIENAQGERMALHHLARVGLVTNFTTEGNRYHLQYDPATELLRCRSDARGDVFLYDYDPNGRLLQALTSTGELWKLSSRLVAPRSLEVTVGRGNQQPYIININTAEGTTSFSYGEMSTEIRQLPNSSLLLRQPDGARTHIEFTKSQQLLTLYADPIQALDSVVAQRRVVPGDLTYDRLETDLTLQLAPLQGNQMHGFLVTRQMQSNATSILSVSYDPVTLRQSFVLGSTDGSGDDASPPPALTVKYKESVEPDTWAPHGMPEMFVLYDSAGRLQRWRWAELSRRYTYGSRGGLTRRRVGARDDTFTYDPHSQPATFTLPSGRQYEYHYDSRGGVQFIITPSRSRHFVHIQPSLGHAQLHYQPPVVAAAGAGAAGAAAAVLGGPAGPWVRQYSQDGRLTVSRRPGGLGTIVHRYDGAGRLTATASGDGETQLSYAAGGQLAHVRHTDRQFGYRCQLRHQGPLLRQTHTQYQPETSLAPLLLRYQYDRLQRVTRVSGRLGGRQLAPLQLRYSSRSGQLTRLAGWRLQYPAGNQTVLTDGAWRLTRHRDQHGRETLLTLTLDGRQLVRMRTEYDSEWRVAAEHEWREDGGSGGAARPSVRRLQYDADGQLTGDDGADAWRFQYDGNGNLVMLQVKHSNISLEVDAADRLVRLAGASIQYDAAGSVVRSFRDHVYQWNARGLLTTIARPAGGQRVRYFYDQLRRPVARRDQLGNITQFVYADPRFPRRVTHVFRPRADRLTQLVYDDAGRPVQLRADAAVYTVVSDGCGTPRLLYDSGGRLARRLVSSAYGHPVSDSWPQLELPLAWCGALWEPTAELLLWTDGRVSDPLVGQWLSPDVDALLSNLMNPRRLHLYRINGNDPVNMATDAAVDGDAAAVTSPPEAAGWLRRLGYRLDRLAPQLLSQPAVFPVPQLSASAPQLSTLQPLAGQLGRLRQLLMTSDRLGLVSRVPEMTLRRQPEPERRRRRVSSRPGPLGAGCLISTDAAGRVSARGVPAVDPIAADVLTQVLNQSYLLNVTWHQHGRETLHFVKPQLWSFSDDHAQLSRLAPLNVSAHKPTGRGDSSDGRAGSAHHVAELRIRTATATVHVRYGVQPHVEYGRHVRHAHRLSARAAWAYERQLVSRGLWSRRWSAAEREAILARDGVPGVSVSHRHAADVYPELAGDLFNVRLGGDGRWD